MDEARRIEDAYRKRKAKGNSPYSQLFSHQRKQEIISAVKGKELTSLENKNFLDVGCGEGVILSYFLELGAKPENLYGFDLLPERIESAKKNYPSMQFTCGNAENLPYPDNFFDIAMQFTVFTSILNFSMKKKIALEMLRVLKPEGMIMWHDYRFNNPFNKDVRGIGRREIKDLFPDCKFEFKLIHLNPVIGRQLTKISLQLCLILEKLPIMRTHWMAVIKKK